MNDRRLRREARIFGDREPDAVTARVGADSPRTNNRPTIATLNERAPCGTGIARRSSAFGRPTHRKRRDRHVVGGNHDRRARIDLRRNGERCVQAHLRKPRVTGMNTESAAFGPRSKIVSRYPKAPNGTVSVAANAGVIAKKPLHASKTLSIRRGSARFIGVLFALSLRNCNDGSVKSDVQISEMSASWRFGKRAKTFTDAPRAGDVAATSRIHAACSGSDARAISGHDEQRRRIRERVDLMRRFDDASRHIERAVRRVLRATTARAARISIASISRRGHPIGGGTLRDHQVADGRRRIPDQQRRPEPRARRPQVPWAHRHRRPPS